ncbi:hypothetical protein AKJ41_02995 [candidate division MSBL1 archaeon SCGC-AAA259O05]|uniref:Uncharacterized protein n=1 Tax=candidate division MSBL1 archaeon SCGC-AAA259O05 TaxID=1698271 RepID=A0A133V3L1_9EURY|nr:hypothetical protein AKJ41_02995 [candidate division MSBL1 archaeon SCGC-AAA259O05]
MRQTDCLPASFILPVSILAVLFLLATPPAVSAYQPRPRASIMNLDNASLNVHVLVEGDGRVTTDASFHMEKKIQAVSKPFAQIPIKSGELDVRAKRAGDNLVKVNTGVRAILVEKELGTKAKFGLSFLDALAIEEINERYAPKIENLYSKLRRTIKGRVRTFQKTPENTQGTLESVNLPRLKKFRLTSFDWDVPELKVSATADFAHRSFKKNLNLPMRLNISASISEKLFEMGADFSATPKGPGLENASFYFSASREDNLALLNASATAEGKMPKRDNMYVVDLSQYMKGVGEGKFQQLENVKLPENFHATLELEVSKGLRVENQPSVPSYCKNEKCRTYVWENEDAVEATTSLLSGESTFAVKSVPSGNQPQEGPPLVLVGTAILVACAAVLAGAYFYRRRGVEE